MLNAHYQQTIIHGIRDLCITQPHKYKFVRVTQPTEAEREREEMGEEEQAAFVPKQNCYSVNLAGKEAPDAAKGLPLDLEGVVNTLAKTQHYKLIYKKFKYDFYKDNGFCDEKETIKLRDDKKKNKNVICFILVVIGNSVQIEYEIKEEGNDYSYKRVLESGDAFFIDQKVKHFSYRVV